MAASVGLPVEFVDSVPVPFPFAGAVALPGQIGPRPVPPGVGDGGRVRRRGRSPRRRCLASRPARRRPVELRTAHGVVRADDAVIATATPFLNRGLYFAKVRAARARTSRRTGSRMPRRRGSSSRSTVPCARCARPPIRLRATPATRPRCCSSAATITRWAASASTEAQVQDLIGWTARYFPGAELTHRWAAQDYESLDRIPFVGRMPRGRGRIWFATGYAKWGLTNGVAAAIRILEEICRACRGAIGGGGSPSSARARRARGPRPGRRRGCPGRRRARASDGRRPSGIRPRRPAGRGRGRRRLEARHPVRRVDRRRQHVRRAGRLHATSAARSRGTTPSRRGTARCTARASRHPVVASRGRPCTTCRRSRASEPRGERRSRLSPCCAGCRMTT